MADELPDRERTIKIDILIGNDYYDDVINMEKIQIDDGLYLVNSTLGWMFSGRVPENEKGSEEYAMFVSEDKDDMENYWQLETIGIKSEDDI